MPYVLFFLGVIYGVLFSLAYNFLAGESSEAALALVAVLSPVVSFFIFLLFLIPRRAMSLGAMMMYRVPESGWEKMEAARQRARRDIRTFVFWASAYLALPIILNLASKIAGSVGWQGAGEAIFAYRWWSLLIVGALIILWSKLADRLSEKRIAVC